MIAARYKDLKHLEGIEHIVKLYKEINKVKVEKEHDLNFLYFRRWVNPGILCFWTMAQETQGFWETSESQENQLPNF